MGMHNKGYLVATFLHGPTEPYERMDVSAAAEWNKYNIHAFPLATWQNGIIQIQLALCQKPTTYLTPKIFQSFDCSRLRFR